MTDAFGEPLEVGDFVGYITGGRYQDTFKGRIVQIKKMIQVEVTVAGNGVFVKEGATRWIHPHRATRTLEDFSNLCDCDWDIS